MKGARVAKRWFTRFGVAFLLLIAGVIALAWSYDVIAAPKVVMMHPPIGDFITVGSSKIHYLCRGETEPTLVLQHGYAGGVIDWLPLMDKLAASHRVCAFDRLGNDYSDTIPAGTWSFSDVIDTWHAALTQLGITNPIVVGHSIGGAIVQLYGARYPVQGIILIDGLSADVADKVVTRLGSYGALAPLARLGLLRPLAPSFVHPSYAGELHEQMLALRSRSSAIVSFASEGRMAQQDLSTQALLAAEDKMTAPLLILAAGATDVPEGEAFTSSLTALAARYPNSKLHIIPGASHYLMVTHAEQVAAAIQTWLHVLSATSLKSSKS